MQGLRQQESQKFEKFFQLVQDEAKKKGCVFFLDCGLGNVFENDNIECEDLTGWLVEKGQVSEFEQIFAEDLETDDFDEAYCSVLYSVDGTGSIKIDIVNTPSEI